MNKLNEYLLAGLAFLLGAVLTLLVARTPGLDMAVSGTVVQWLVKECLYAVFSIIGLFFLAGADFNIVSRLKETPEGLIGLAIFAGLWIHGFASVLA